MSRLSLLALFLLPAGVAAAEPLAVEVKADVTYATVDGVKLQLDLAVPKAPGPHPVVVCLHGGAWKGGRRQDLSRATSFYDIGNPGKSFIEVMAERGFAAASISYRLAPQNKFPSQIQDAKTAVRFLRANAKLFGLDPDRVAALGFSAGGHIAALMGTTDGITEFEGTLYPEQSSKVDCVVDFFGPADLTLYAETPAVEKAFMVPFLGGRARDQLELYKRASPIEHVSKDDAPFLILHGTADILVPVIHSERFHEKLTAAGVKAELVTVKGEGHGWRGEVSRQTIDASTKFLTEYLVKKGK